MAGISGKNGKIMIGSSNLTDCTGWTFDREVEIHKYGSCSSNGFKKKVDGTKDGMGTISGKYDPDDPIEDYIEEGDHVTLLLYVDASKFYSVPAIIAKLSVKVDVDSGEPVSWDADFEADGQWTLPA